MKIFSIVLILLLTSCGAFVKNEDQIKKFGYDIVDEEVNEISTHDNVDSK